MSFNRAIHLVRIIRQVWVHWGLALHSYPIPVPWWIVWLNFTPSSLRLYVSLRSTVYQRGTSFCTTLMLVSISRLQKDHLWFIPSEFWLYDHRWSSLAASLYFREQCLWVVAKCLEVCAKLIIKWRVALSALVLGALSNGCVLQLHPHAQDFLSLLVIKHLLLNWLNLRLSIDQPLHKAAIS